MVKHAYVGYNNTQMLLQYPINNVHPLPRAPNQRKSWKTHSMAVIIILFLLPRFKTSQVHPNSFRINDSWGRGELDGNAVHAVALVSRRLEAFSLKHMAQMPTAGSACDLYPPTIRVSLNTRETRYSVCHPEKINNVMSERLLKHTVLCMAPGSPSKKAGQPQPESNLVVDLYRGVPQPAQLYTPPP
jgi:hypothetical protein